MVATNDRKSAREFLWKKHGDEALLDTYTGEELVEFAEAYAAERVSVLERALRGALERIWEHHELGHIRRAYEAGAGSCQLCRDGIFQQIEAALGETERPIHNLAAQSPEYQEAARILRKVQASKFEHSNILTLMNWKLGGSAC